MTDPCTTALPCLVHGKHVPASRVNHFHHVWPLGHGGPDIPENKVVICPTGHANVHALLHEYVLLRGEVPYMARRWYSREEQALALLGWRRMTNGAM